MLWIEQWWIFRTLGRVDDENHAFLGFVPHLWDTCLYPGVSQEGAIFGIDAPKGNKNLPLLNPQRIVRAKQCRYLIN